MAEIISLTFNSSANGVCLQCSRLDDVVRRTFARARATYVQSQTMTRAFDRPLKKSLRFDQTKPEPCFGVRITCENWITSLFSDILAKAAGEKVSSRANSVMIRPLFAFEDVVLYVFVVVQSFFVWVFSTVHNRVMNVPGVSNVLRPLSLPSLAAGSTSAPPEPAGLAPPPPPSSGSRSASRSRESMVENTLPAAVFRGPRSYLICVGDSRLPADVAPAPRQASGIKWVTGIFFASTSHQRIAKSILPAAVLRTPGFWYIYLEDCRLAEGSPALPSEPADVAAPPRASGSRSAFSSHERSAENILPAVVLRGPRFCYICFKDVGLAAGSPAPPPGPADVAPAPPQASGNYRVTGDNPVMSIPSIALEATVVLNSSVDVQSIFVPPRLSARSPAQPAVPADVAPAPPLSSGANITMICIPSDALEDTAVPDTSVDVQPILVPPRLSARSPAQPAAPADAAPAPPRSSGLRSAWSTRGRIVEGLLSAVVFVYSVIEVASLLFVTPFTWRAELPIGFMVTFSLLPSLHDAFSELRRLWNIPSAGDEGNGVSKYPDLGGVDVSEFDCFQSRYNTVPFLCELTGMQIITLISMVCPYKALVLIATFVLPSVDPSIELVVHIVRIGLGCILSMSLYVYFVATTEDKLLELLKKWEKHCVKQPRCRHVRVFLLGGGTIFAVLLYLSPVPAGWTSSLIMAHSGRLLSLLVALRGDTEGVADAAAEGVGHVLEAL